MGFFDRLLGQSRDDPRDRCARMGAAVATRLREHAKEHADRLADSGTSLRGGELLFKVWTLKAAVFAVVAERVSTHPERLDWFFQRFWSLTSAQLGEEFSLARADGRLVKREIGAAADVVRLGVQASDPKMSFAFGLALAVYLGFPKDERRSSILAPLAIEHEGYIAAAAKLLKALPA